ncbi:hypothetical protein [Nakamurella sp. PAMC28650]|uniref:hypothetical protein n=1 Tax=Nakamurella sp. PAMC28650 TaxID=2762325 RepID=UPI00164D44B2|nr:hypothetical protein [Nakamurella sp. PAMC28650]QNK84059.1 hypothetical protein H7F38_02840 [Nakamurella sp. PAMC28650]
MPPAPWGGQRAVTPTALALQSGLPQARRLLGAGADPDITDRRFGSTPPGWAEHFERDEMTELLPPLTGSA